MRSTNSLGGGSSGGGALGSQIANFALKDLRRQVSESKAKIRELTHALDEKTQQHKQREAAAAEQLSRIKQEQVAMVRERNEAKQAQVLMAHKVVSQTERLEAKYSKELEDLRAEVQAAKASEREALRKVKQASIDSEVEARRLQAESMATAAARELAKDMQSKNWGEEQALAKLLTVTKQAQQRKLELAQARTELAEARDKLFAAQERAEQRSRDLLQVRQLHQTSNGVAVLAVLRTRHRATIANAFGRLRQHAETARQAAHENRVRAMNVQAKQQIALELWRHTSATTGEPPTLRVVMGAWRMLTVRNLRDRRLVQSAARILNRRSLVKLFASWVRYTKAKMRRHRLVTLSNRRRNLRQLQMVMQEWHVTAHKSSRDRAVMETTVAAFEHNSSGAGQQRALNRMGEWKRKAKQRGAGRVAIECLQQNPVAQVRKAFHHWRTTTAGTSTVGRMVHCLAKHHSRHRTDRLRSAFGKWGREAARRTQALVVHRHKAALDAQAATSKLQKLALILQQSTLRQQFRAFHQWRRTAANQTAQMQRAIAMLNSRAVSLQHGNQLHRLRRALGVWNTAARAAKTAQFQHLNTLQVAVGGVLKRVKWGAVQRAFQRWHAVTNLAAVDVEHRKREAVHRLCSLVDQRRGHERDEKAQKAFAVALWQAATAEARATKRRMMEGALWGALRVRATGLLAQVRPVFNGIWLLLCLCGVW